MSWRWLLRQRQSPFHGHSKSVGIRAMNNLLSGNRFHIPNRMLKILTSDRIWIRLEPWLWRMELLSIQRVDFLYIERTTANPFEDTDPFISSVEYDSSGNTKVARVLTSLSGVGLGLDVLLRYPNRRWCGTPKGPIPRSIGVDGDHVGTWEAGESWSWICQWFGNQHSRHTQSIWLYKSMF